MAVVDPVRPRWWRRVLGIVEPTPPAPQGVRLTYTDGTESGPLPLVYIGRDAEGLAVWEAMLPPRDERTPAGLVAATVPGRTVLRLAV